MLLERGADVTCRDDRGVSALDYAIRENKQEVARALLDCGAKVDALKKGLSIESATMLAKIGAEKGIMISGMSRDQTEADFSNQGLQPADTILIGSDLKFMAGVTTLDLSVNRIGDDGAKVIAEALKVKDSKIMSLDASSENIGPVGGKLISEALRTSVTGGLTSINLSGNHLTNYGTDMTGIKELAAALGVNGALTMLSLARSMLGEEGTKAICEALEQNKTLKELDISGDEYEGNIGGSAGAKHVAKMLGVNGGLTSLNLSDNQLCGLDQRGNGTYTAEGITAIADALRVNGALMALDLSSRIRA